MIACVSAMYSYAAGSIVIPNVEIPQGGVVWVPINVSNDENFSDANMDIYTNNTALTIEDAIPGDLCTDHATTITPKTDFFRFTVTTTTGTMWTAQSGSIWYLKFVDDGSKPLGTVYTCNTSGVKFARSGYAVVPTDVSFTVTVVDHYTIDENSRWIGIDAAGVKVAVNRTIKANTWSTICLPFEMDADMIDDAFGTGTEVVDFSEALLHTSANATSAGTKVDNIQIELTTMPTDERVISPNTPCLIKVPSAVTTFGLDAVDLAAEDEPKTESNQKLYKIDSSATWSATKRKSYLVGNYNPNTVLDEDALYLSDNKYYYSNGSTKMKALRAYFNLFVVLSNKNVGSPVKDLSFEVDGVLVDAIEGISAEEVAANGWYDLNGRKLSAKPAAKGIYINNGKKVVVK